ncbi:nuclear transport factor 2 family protein [Rhodoferax sp.]|uniref:nuclear transport factor 2 family protein n=1 Tax=Rhodoferax sp. TaxID=50421 RepID=UPI00374D68CA
MHPNAQTLSKFYSAFAALDADTMASCYAADAVFDDPAFSLKGQREVAGMWRMLCAATQAKGREVWQLEFSGIEAAASSGRAHWEAHYRFSATGRLVHNIIDAQFTFTPDGLIATQRDHFDFWRWSRQALGTPGLLLGWTPWLRAKVRAQAAANLRKFLAGKR